jgi:hypothetical protein
MIFETQLVFVKVLNLCKGTPIVHVHCAIFVVPYHFILFK